jgi:hypothetical protein
MAADDTVVSAAAAIVCFHPIVRSSLVNPCAGIILALFKATAALFGAGAVPEECQQKSCHIINYHLIQ